MKIKINKQLEIKSQAIIKWLVVGVVIVGLIYVISPLTMKPKFGESIPEVVALFETSLQSKITSTANSMTLVSGTTVDGTTLSGRYGFIIDEGSADEEFVVCNCVDTACSSCLRGVSVVDGVTEITANKSAHRRGASVKMTNYPLLGNITNIMRGSSSIPNLIYYDQILTVSGASSTVIADKAYVDSVGAGGFTAANIGGGLTIRANGTAPETLDINTSTNKWFEIQGGYFDIATGTDSFLKMAWDSYFIATSTWSGNLTINGNATTTGYLVIGSPTYDNPGTGDLFIGGHTTSTGSIDVGGELCFSGANCGSSLNPPYDVDYTTATTTGTTASQLYSTTITANDMASDSVLKVHYIGYVQFQSANHAMIGAYFGGEIVATSTFSQDADNELTPIEGNVYIYNRGSQSLQWAYHGRFNPHPLMGNNTNYGYAATSTEMKINTANNQTFMLLGDTSNANDDISIIGVDVQILK